MLYATDRLFRLRQILIDAAAAAWAVFWIVAGVNVFRLVDRLGAPGVALQRAGSDIRTHLTNAGQRMASIPIVGDALQDQLQRAAGAGELVIDAGRSQAETASSLARWLAAAVIVIPIVWMMSKYLPGRIAWIREAGAISKLRLNDADLELLAIRAIATRPLTELVSVSADPAGDLREGRYATLAGLELKRLGLSSGSA